MAEKYQREIEEILGNLDGLLLDKAKPKKGRVLRAVGSLFGGRPWRISPGRILLGGLSLLLIALLLKGNIPGLVIPIIVWTGVGLLILGYALFFIGLPHYERRWRGRVVETSPRWRQRVLRWFKGH